MMILTRLWSKGKARKYMCEENLYVEVKVYIRIVYLKDGKIQNDQVLLQYIQVLNTYKPSYIQNI